MGLVTEVDDAAAPTVLIVDNNPMSSMRLSNLFKTRNFIVELCEDGDQAVDEYIRLDPELVVLSLDIPSLDGHLAALEMREHGGESRIVFVAPARMADVARNAAYSAGAVAWLQKPISGESLEAAWSTILGTIPEAPGLDDLDELYPDRVSIEEDTGPMVAPLPLPGQLPPLGELPPLDALPALEVTLPSRKSKKGRIGFVVFVISCLIAGGLGYAYQEGMLPV
ncbi:MAG: response regulator [Candidatus Thermoplasmatota archaeon]|nr:response regulator [Candidatus Thermoplasmatota archaeon]MEC8577135.1 response regulator [Candidatus Thermoplasmatota archaeon]MEC8816858.1 response regulator [Candidatus Thermoplasmatota archaeon]